MAQPHFRRRTPQGVAFYTTALVVSLFAIYSLLRPSWPAGPAAGPALGVRDLVKQDEECRLVHQAPDQCTFVRENCPDEEAGLLSYLQLYYCSLANLKPVAFVILVVWISLLFSTIGIAASDFLCVNLGTISNILGMSESLAGVTFLAFGNGSPDVFSTFAAMRTNSGSLAVGELMGAAGFITAVVAGSMALVKPFKVAKRSFVRDVLFFAVAASFSLVFLADGSLRWWECAAMVAFYVFYVAFVVCWHWWIQRRRRIRLSEHTARSYHHIPDQQELDIDEFEDDEEARPTSERTSLLEGPDAQSLVGTPAWKAQDLDPEEDDDARNRALAELASNMRVSRQERGERRNTVTPIRPSLIGALEFRSVLHNLERKSTHNRPINLRRYSDEPSLDGGPERAHGHHHNSQSISIVEGIADQDQRSLMLPSTGRTRAVSANDAGALRISREFLGLDEQDSATVPRVVAEAPAGQDTPRLLLSPTVLTPPSGGSSPSSMHATRPTLLIPPDDGFLHPEFQAGRLSSAVPSTAVSFGSPSPLSLSPGATDATPSAPTLVVSLPTGAVTPSDHHPPRSPSSRAPSIRLPPASVSPESSYSLPFPEQDQEREFIRYQWWPYNHLPPPQIIFATLFPTLYGWAEKSLWDRLLGIVTAPSVFLLTITLPVVESNADDDLPSPDPGLLSPDVRPRVLLPSDSPGLGEHSPLVSVGNHSHGRLSRSNTDLGKLNATETDQSQASLKAWNRWLVIVQLFTAPLFVAIIAWANLAEDAGAMLLLKMILGSLAISLVCLFILLLTTSADREPRYRPLLCFLGFAVAIAWISTIANEVVGVLKAFGVVLNISDAILGLTIFAVGNSLGDLVADITVAKLGYPVMALSACFGGPMLNILLGIGLGGLYMTISHAPSHKHRKHRTQWQPYQLEVSTTLMVSGVFLLVTLLGLLVVVPMNKWRMDRKIGIGLIVLWCLSTLINVVLEITGLEGKWES